MFVVRLPGETEPASVLTAAAPARVDAVSPADGKAVRLDGIRVLVVEDKPDTRRLLEMMLKLSGASTGSAGSTEEAIQRLDEGSFDVLLSDIGMPDEDGFSLMRRVRSRPPERGGNIPAAALTGYADAESRRQCLEAGFQAHLHKPVERAELVAAVARLAGRA
jgi:CheY-like chemotaxis protein